ncbi:hypothetical protein [Desulfosarcina sp.]|uniref:hypothetical protein n=1 Tax=Desulfosarcina sp. TaxID=2027861 RepID=UPI0029A75BF8|nr:hypothetical protein [Desulfosarcina sp.]MDX2454583.1 hypothetical protein [Desulfosarcina sp.]MDX2492207.1 hypothetical protein [Desulfosarcina sp.]
MACRCRKTIVFILSAMVTVLCYSSAFPQETPPELRHQPARLEVVQEYLNKLGYTKARPFREKNLEGLAFIIKDKRTDEIIKLSALLNPNDRLLKIECHDLATVPPNPDRLILLFQKLTELNGTRTIGKYYVNFDNGQIQYFYFQSVLGGICFADFERTVRLIEIILFNDIKSIRELSAS